MVNVPVLFLWEKNWRETLPWTEAHNIYNSKINNFSKFFPLKQTILQLHLSCIIVGLKYTEHDHQMDTHELLVHLHGLNFRSG
jgi:hypothetical protein